MIARTTLALLVVPLLPALAFALFTPVGGGSINTDLGSVLGLTLLFYFWSFAAAVLFGIPLFCLLLKLRLVRWWTALLSGAIVGVLVSVLLRLPSAPYP